MSGSHAHALHYHGHSPVHHLPGEIKLVGLLIFVLSVVSTPPTAIWAFSGYALILMVCLGLSEVPAKFFVTRMAIDLPFVLFAFLIPFVGVAPKIAIGPFSISEPGLLSAWNILVKATLGAGASVLLAATTEVPDVLKGLQRLKVPTVLVAIASFMIRYLDVVAGEFRRTRVAMAARGHNPRTIFDARPLAVASGALFIRSYERGERVHQAMLARGYDGTWPLARRAEIPIRTWIAGLAPAATAMIVAIMARVL
ncbi:cobalt ECF transporter T component CbiQ [soil metagenome]